MDICSEYQESHSQINSIYTCLKAFNIISNHNKFKSYGVNIDTLN